MLGVTGVVCGDPPHGPLLRIIPPKPLPKNPKPGNLSTAAGRWFHHDLNLVGLILGDGTISHGIGQSLGDGI